MAKLTLWEKDGRRIPVLVKDSPAEIILRTPDLETARRVMEKMGYQQVLPAEQFDLFQIQEIKNETTS